MKKRLGGFKNINVAPLIADGTYGTPVPVSGAKSIEAELSYEQVKFYADNAADYSDYIFSGGEGSLTLSGLTMSEYELLFGSTVGTGDVLVKSTDQAPDLAILFERNKLGSQDKVLYCLFSAKFAPPAISAQTLEGNIEEEVVELAFSLRELPDGKVFRMCDTESALPALVDSWYQTVPKQ